MNMEQSQKTSSRTLDALAGAFKQIRARMDRLGLNLSLWDSEGNPTGEFAPSCHFCKAVGNSHVAPCMLGAQNVAMQVASQAEPVAGSSEIGCSIIGVPVYKRRRLVGAAVACFPTTQMQDEESMARMCDRLRLDRKVMSELAVGACRREAGSCQYLLPVLDWLVQDQRALDVAEGELATLSTNLANTYEELSLAYAISGSMRVTQKPHEFLQRVCDELLEVVSLAGATAVVYKRDESDEEEIVVTAGDVGLDESQVKLLVSGELAPHFAKNTRTRVDNNFVPPSDGRFGKHIRNLVAVPMVAEDSHIGMLVGINKLTGEFDSVDTKLIGSIVSQAAVFLANHRLYADLQDLLMGVLHALTASIDAKDPYTCGHSHRVARIAKRLAEESKFSPEKAEQVYLAGLLHDIGKIGVPERILCKAGRLTDQEYDIMRRHSLLGAKILGGIRRLKDMIVAIRTHHERPDGMGYPGGMAGNEVPIEGLIIGLADAFDSMTSDRTYRQALSLEDVIIEIKRHTGTQFDPALVRTLLSIDLEAFLKELQEPAGTNDQQHLAGEVA